MRQELERALSARRRSRRVEFRERFDVESDRDWCELIKDVVALANSGGGVIVFGVDNGGRAVGADVDLDPSRIAARLQQYVESDFDDFLIVGAAKGSSRVTALAVGEALVPLVFSKPGCAPPGTLYFRHGAKSQPATSDDVAALMARRVKAVRKSWLSAVKRVTEAPEGFFSDSAGAAPIRIVEDPRAPAYRVVDYDKTHPYRQKELLAAFRGRVPSRPINQFDLLAVRHVHGIDEKEEFSHKSLYGARQYSERFLDWLATQAAHDPLFFDSARSEYLRARAASG